MRFVPIKNEEQQVMQALHRVREQLVKNRMWALLAHGDSYRMRIGASAA